MKAAIEKIKYSDADVDRFAEFLLSSASVEDIARLIDGRGSAGEFARFQTDPVGFCEQVLCETVTDDIRAMMESVRENKITIAKSANATGKTWGAARAAIWWFRVFNESKVYTVAPTFSHLRDLLWGEIGAIVNRNPDVFTTDHITDLSILRNSESKVIGVPIPTTGTAAKREGKFSGKHSPFLLFIVDEGDAVPDEVYRGIESCMSGGRARLLIMFNPRSESGPVYRMERDRIANVVEITAFNHPNVIEGSDVIPGAVTREETVSRVNRWCRPLLDDETPTRECFELPAFLDGATAVSTSGGEYPPLKAGWYKIIEPAFSYMVLGQYPAQGTNQLISREWINRARTNYDLYVREYGDKPPVGTTGRMGLDVADDGGDETVAALRYGGYVPPMIVWNGVDVLMTSSRAAKESKKHNIKDIHVDATGVGAGVAPVMRRHFGVNAHRVQAASKATFDTELGLFKHMRDQLYWSVREWLRTDPGAMLPPDETLIEELATPTYRVNGAYVEVMKKDDMKELLGGRSPDRLDALSYTFAPNETVLNTSDLDDCFES